MLETATGSMKETPIKSLRIIGRKDMFWWLHPLRRWRSDATRCMRPTELEIGGRVSSSLDGRWCVPFRLSVSVCVCVRGGEEDFGGAWN